MTTSLGQLWKNEYFQTVIIVLLIVTVFFGFFFGLRLALNTNYPVLAVASGSMSLTPATDNGWYPFSRTLHTGDLIIVEGVNPKDIYAAPFNESGRSGDILVFRESAGSDELIVHRAVGETTVNGETEFVTQGDNRVTNPIQGPGSPTPADNVIGKVVFRIPWIGYLALVGPGTRSLVLALIIIMIAIELVLPTSRSEDTETKKDGTVDKVSES